MGRGARSRRYHLLLQALIPEFARRNRVIRYDFIGHGRTTLTGELTIESLTDDLSDVITEVTGESPIIVVHSMGTLFAQRLAATGQVQQPAGLGLRP